jgi:hypothetical protein
MLFSHPFALRYHNDRMYKAPVDARSHIIIFGLIFSRTIMTFYAGDKLPAHYLLPLDDKLYNLDNEAVAFYKQQTGIDDDEDVKRHILEIQEKAYAVEKTDCSCVLLPLN